MGACPESRVEARGGRTVGRGPRRHERQRAPREDETGLRHAVHLGARVLHHVVPEETGEDDVGREAGAPPAESQKSLVRPVTGDAEVDHLDRKSTRLNSSHLVISYAVFCLKKKKTTSSCSYLCITCTTTASN